ncbi:MAG: RcnB family protein [Sphingomicrobium sp.]
MRKVFAFVLLAGVTAPVLAAGSGERPGHHGANQSAAEDRGDRPSRSSDTHVDRGNRGGNDRSSSQSTNAGSSERAHFGGIARPERGGGNDQPQPVVTRVETNSGGGHADRVTRVESNGGVESREARLHNGVRSRFSSGGTDVRAVQTTEPGSTDRVRRWTGPKVIEAPHDVGATGTLRESRRRLPSVFRNRVPIVANTPHEGTQPPLRTEGRRSNWASWSTSHWRSDHRYNWREHRRRHRSLFHFSFYSDPFGWGYRPYQIGWRLWPSYFGSRYWLNDPWQYRLPYAPPGYRWIRYYDDAILVDTWDGRVVDVIYNFFW